MLSSATVHFSHDSPNFFRGRLPLTSSIPRRIIRAHNVGDRMSDRKFIRSDVLFIKLIPEEKDLVRQIADRRRVTMTQAVADILRREGEEMGLWPPNDGDSGQ